MGLRKTDTATPAATATAEAPETSPVNVGPATAPTATTMSPEERKVRGQVRMHAIIAGYKVASGLAATLATSPQSVRQELHNLALEVADKIEAHSFK